jgi:hypothetical protein
MLILAVSPQVCFSDLANRPHRRSLLATITAGTWACVVEYVRWLALQKVSDESSKDRNQSLRAKEGEDLKVEDSNAAWRLLTSLWPWQG